MKKSVSKIPSSKGNITKKFNNLIYQDRWDPLKIHETSPKFNKWASRYLKKDYLQFENDPVWLDGNLVVKLYDNPEYLEGIIEAHQRLDPEQYSSKLIDIFQNPSNNEYGVAEEYIEGTNLSSLEPEIANVMIELFYQLMVCKFKASDWDSNPENYIIDKSTGRLKVIDLGDLWF